MAYTERFTEVHEIVDDELRVPVVKAAGLYTGTPTSMSNYQRATFLVSVGALGGGASVTVQVWQRNPDTGAAQIVAGKGVFTAAADYFGVIEVKTEEMEVSDGYSELYPTVTILNDTAALCLVFIKHAANYPPVPTTGVDQITD